MSTYGVEVDVATARPPRTDATMFVVVGARNAQEAELVACQMAYCHPFVVMAVGSRVVENFSEESLA